MGTLYSIARGRSRVRAHRRARPPLIGAGDWNDGMNRVGRRAKAACGSPGSDGDAPALAIHADARRPRPRCCAPVRRLCRRGRANGVGREVYRRAYCDDGTPLGTASDDECRIGHRAELGRSLGAGDPRALSPKAVNEPLVRDEAGLLLLLAAVR